MKLTFSWQKSTFLDIGVMRLFIFGIFNPEHMKCSSNEQVLPCLSDPWKLRIIAYLDTPPDLKELAENLKARYSESLGVVLVRLGRREVNFFASGKVTIREVNDIEEGKKLVNSILSMSAQKQILKEL